MAYGQIHDWLLGNTLTNACSANGSVWTCDFTGPNGYKAQAVWDTLMTCNDGSCGTAVYVVDGQFLDYLRLLGWQNKQQIINGESPDHRGKPICC